MKENKLLDAANEFGYHVVETTSAQNGYPELLKYGVMGFIDFAEAEDFAKSNGLTLRYIQKKDGWNLWVRRGIATTPYDRSNDFNDGDWRSFTSYSQKDYYENEIKPMLEEFNDIDSLEYFIENQKEIMDNLDNIDENEMVITHCGKFDDVIDRYPISFSYDTWNYDIIAM
jgi:hypothetical protein